jgi:biopolymer transport protein ExbB
MIRLHRNGSGELELVEQAIQRALVVEMPTLEKRMGLLATLGAVAPLLGLLGTVSGMITLFKVITEVGSNDARLLAGGISEALITTEAGLIIAIPILLIHGWLSERVEEITAILRTTILEVLNILWPGGEASSHQFIAELQKEMADHPDSQKHHHPEKEEEASG